MQDQENDIILDRENDITLDQWTRMITGWTRRRTTSAHWRQDLTEGERHLVSFATMYCGHFAGAVAGNERLELIAKLAALLDGRPVEV